MELNQVTAGAGGKFVKNIPSPSQAGSLFGLIRTTGGLLSWDQMSDKVIQVTDPSHFGVIDSTKVYVVSSVDMGTTEIEVPIGGINILGYTFDVSNMFSTEDNYTMFTSPVGGSGNILIENCGLSISGTSSSVFATVDADGTHAIELNKVNFDGCISLGYMEDYRQILENGTGRFGGTPELELRGAMNGYSVNTSIIRGLSNLTSIYKTGAGLVFSGRFITNINCDLPATGALFDFSDSEFTNDDSLAVNGAYITRQGVINTDDLAVHPNINESSVKSLWKGNTGIPNTTKYINGDITTEIDTDCTLQNTFYPLLGTFTISQESHFSMPSNGEFKLLTGNGTYQVVANLILDSTQNDVINTRIMKSSDDGATWPTELKHIRRQVNSLVGSRDVASVPIAFIATLKKGDRIRIEVENETSAGSTITAELDSFLSVLGG